MTFGHNYKELAMQLFQCVRTACQRMGIFLYHPNQNQTFNLKIVLTVLPILFFIISSMAFLLFEAQTMQDYQDSFIASSSTIMASLNFAIIVFWKVPKMLEMIESFEKIIEKSKFFSKKSIFLSFCDETIANSF